MGTHATTTLLFAIVSVAMPSFVSAADSGPQRATHFEGVLVRSDGQTLSIELRDTRIVRFRVNAATVYATDGGSSRLTDFRTADFVAVQAEPANRGYLLAVAVTYLRKASAEEEAEVLESPELNYRREESVILSVSIDPAQDTRRLSLVAKPDALASAAELTTAPAPSVGSGDALIASIRGKVENAFEHLPNFRANLITSMFHSNARHVTWVPTGVISAEIAYEGNNEQFSNVEVNGRRPPSAPDTADSEYMRSFNNAWSTGDFETIAHCVFDRLQDSDFHRVDVQRHVNEGVAVYEFAGSRASTCVAVRSESQVAYPSYKGSLKVSMKTGNVTHVELEATHIPSGFPLDRAERSVDFSEVGVGNQRFLLPTTGYWFGCYRNSYYCFMNRLDFRDYRHFESDTKVKFVAGN